jgi:hypothetical protein
MSACARHALLDGRPISRACRGVGRGFGGGQRDALLKRALGDAHANLRDADGVYNQAHAVEGRGERPCRRVPGAEHEGRIARDAQIVDREVGAAGRTQPQGVPGVEEGGAFGIEEGEDAHRRTALPHHRPLVLGQDGQRHQARRVVRGAAEGPVAVDDVALSGRSRSARGHEGAARHGPRVAEQFLDHRRWQELIEGGDEHAVTDYPPRGRVDARERFHHSERRVWRHLKPTECLRNPHPQQAGVHERRHHFWRHLPVHLRGGRVTEDQRFEVSNNVQGINSRHGLVSQVRRLRHVIR